MPRVTLTDHLRRKYQRLLNTCQVRDNKIGKIDGIISKIVSNKKRYEDAGRGLGVPWYFIAVIHNMESSMNFARHLHNGDSLRRRTTHVPKGRPKTGQPPFTWEESATDALKLKKLERWEEWTVPGILYKLEQYNGWGYKLYHTHVLSPYLWSFSNHYSSGKYVADGRWSDTAVSQQAGAAVILRRMAEKGIIKLQDLQISSPAAPQPSAATPMIKYSRKKKSDMVMELQKFLNTCPGIYVNVDGYPGKNTSEAMKKVTGNYLQGDPRNK